MLIYTMTFAPRLAISAPPRTHGNGFSDARKETAKRMTELFPAVTVAYSPTIRTQILDHANADAAQIAMKIFIVLPILVIAFTVLPHIFAVLAARRLERAEALRVAGWKKRTVQKYLVTAYGDEVLQSIQEHDEAPARVMVR
jgi:hypothetical protein